ncbi:MAG TPA: TIGR03557 family F420-dependent LLM class oxidoreductase [Gaiellaceae bacterium]|nr:TIGR03557 family F420-dependent LLM class oxidoreductase [Gaiellaceae bacterium]
MRYLYGAAHEQFPPDDLLRQAVEAEEAGFDGVACSDHFQPWWEPGESGMAWVWLGAAGQATKRATIGTAVTPALTRYHPALVAQAWATLEVMFPGRTFLGIGSGESLNESPLGADWPPPAVQLVAMEEALELIRRLFAGERVTQDGRFPTKDAFLHTRPERAPPIYVSAFHDGAAQVAARFGDGLWTLGDPDSAPDIIEAYEEACAEVGRERGEIVLQVQFSWAPDDDAALEGARVWKGAQPEEFYTDDWHDPRAMATYAATKVPDEELAEKLIVSSDPDEHVERIREVEKLGATAVCVMNVSGADPHGAIAVYREQVLPRLR